MLLTAPTLQRLTNGSSSAELFPDMATLRATLQTMQEQAPDLDMSTLLAALQGHSPSQQAFREATKANAFKLIKARFAATKDCSGDKHTARHAVDALSDSDKPLPLPPADLGT